MQKSPGYLVIEQWLASKKHKPFAFQTQAWQHIQQQNSGIVNAPTGCGKTFSVFLGAVINYINQYPTTYTTRKPEGLYLLWITPLRALAKDIARAMTDALIELQIPWTVGSRNGDTSISDRQKQKRKMPPILLITPESLHLLLTQKNNQELWKYLQIIAVDEWHELIGSKRGVQVELAISNILFKMPQTIAVWGISATIGNLQEASDVLLFPVKKRYNTTNTFLVKANIDKRISIQSIFPDEIENFPWSGHLGLKLAHKLLPIIEQSKTTLIFINTRGMSEIWYQTLLNIAPELAGALALHHGSIEQELRLWVEDALHTEKLKAVVCTASLDLGVDFRPVDTVIQVGSPKGVARFLQRAGRSGHQPGELSKIYFLPTHSLELVEAAALQMALAEKVIESRMPMLLCYDVLIQFLCTIAIGDGFIPQNILPQIRSTFCFESITDDEWNALLLNLSTGGKALQAYDEYKKIIIEANGTYRITNRRIAMRHRMHIGTIVSDAMLKVKLLNGKYIGVIEEWFVSKLEEGDVFTLAGRNVELVSLKDMTALVRISTQKKTNVPSWMGGRMPLSANLGRLLRQALDMALVPNNGYAELDILQPLFQKQAALSHIPKKNELLIEHIETKDGFHLFCYPFEGRAVHEALAAILSHRIGKIMPITFSYAMNDYGFELLSDQPIPLDDANVYELFSLDNLTIDIQKSVNSTEMAKRKFRDIAVIGGLIFQGFPGEQKKARHLQSSASLLFKVFNEYEPNNILLRQAYQEIFDQQLEEARLRNMLERIQQGNIVITYPTQLTPFCFPIKVDSIRESISSEKLEDRVRRMQEQLGKG